MAVPKTLKAIDEKKANSIINKHTKDGTGEWEYGAYESDFVYEGRQTKYGKRYEMLRPFTYCGKTTWEHGVCSM